MLDEQLNDAHGRLARSDEIDTHLGAWTRTRDPADVEAVLRESGVPVSRVVTGVDIEQDDESHASGFFGAVSHPTSGTRHYTGAPVLLSGYGRPATLRPPLLGEHTEQMLYNHLGLTPAEVDDLMARKVVGH